MFAQTSHEYLITQTQFNFFQGLKQGPNTLGTTFNHPLSEIIWFLTIDDLNLYTGQRKDLPDNLSSHLWGSHDPIFTNWEKM